jgi:hypothetical protein
MFDGMVIAVYILECKEHKEQYGSYKGKNDNPNSTLPSGSTISAEGP